MYKPIQQNTIATKKEQVKETAVTIDDLTNKAKGKTLPEKVKSNKKPTKSRALGAISNPNYMALAKQEKPKI